MPKRRSPHGYTLADRFHQKVQKTDGCWLWNGATYERGYGKMSVDGNTVGAHRISWILHNGAIPEGLYVLHSCDNPPCVRPDHLFLGTMRDNIQDMHRKRRANYQTHPERVAKGEAHGTHTRPESLHRGDEHHFRRRPELIPRGERAGTAKLTTEQVLEIRRRYASGCFQKELATEFGVRQTQISNIIRRQSWSHV